MRGGFENDLNWSDVTPKRLWLNRRQLIAAGAALVASPAVAAGYSTDEAPNSLEDISGYNNYYEFGTDKTDPAANAQGLTVDPWSIKIDGMVDKPGTYDLADILKGAPIEERIYRFRCVEAWSMVVPWQGFELGHLLKKVGVQAGALQETAIAQQRQVALVGVQRVAPGMRAHGHGAVEVGGAQRGRRRFGQREIGAAVVDEADAPAVEAQLAVNAGQLARVAHHRLDAAGAEAVLEQQELGVEVLLRRRLVDDGDQAVAASGLDVTIAKAGDEPMDASSILMVMAMGVACGDEVVLEADGPEADRVLDELVTLLATDLDAE